jgi:arabinonate dehydratase
MWCHRAASSCRCCPIKLPINLEVIMSVAVTSILRLNAGDNVVVAIEALAKNQEIPSEHVICRDPIPEGHKVAASAIAKGEAVRKYGQIIGVATGDIQPGDHVHTHNMGMLNYDRHYSFGSETRPTAYVPESEQARFDGIVRANGEVATRNYIGVLATSGCSSSVARFIAQAFDQEVLSAYPNVDGVVAIAHQSGCGLVGRGDHIDYLRRTLAGWAHHPNFAGIFIVGHGCEHVHLDDLNRHIQLDPGLMFGGLSIQSSGGTRKTLQRGIDAVTAMLPDADRVRRQPVPASHLILGLECGGSDALSGVTANPALGYASDLLVRHGGTAILSETTEIYGAEQLLVQRAVSREVGEKLLERVRWWEEYARRQNFELDNNPSPGNKAGGLTTILEKSLGAVAKSGAGNLVDVYGFAEKVTAKGLVFMDTPGYDIVSVTGMVAGGANVVCFTTGRGSVFGSKPVPTLKLATNSAMFRNLEEDMDINCGEIVEGRATVAEVGQSIFQAILDTASGKKSKSELLGFGDSEFAPWMVGATL